MSLSVDDLTELVPPGRRLALGSRGPAPVEEDASSLSATLDRALGLSACPRHGFVLPCPGCASDAAMLSEPRP